MAKERNKRVWDGGLSDMSPPLILGVGKFGFGQTYLLGGGSDIVLSHIRYIKKSHFI